MRRYFLSDVACGRVRGIFSFNLRDFLIPPLCSPLPFPSPRGERYAIALVGMMGAGKTTVGRLVADCFGMPFFDTDDIITATYGQPPQVLFARRGEAAFRRIERCSIATLLREHTICVAATGGGAFLDPRTRHLLRTAAVCVWLRADMAVLLRRCSNHDGRPLLAGTCRRQRFARLLRRRTPIYALADITVNAATIAPRRIADTIARRLHGTP